MSSRDALHSETGGGQPFVDAEPTGSPVIPISPLNDVPDHKTPLGASGSGDDLSSSTFGVPTNLITPDPILGALTDSPIDESTPFERPVRPFIPDPPAPPTVPSGEFSALTGLNLDSPAAPKSSPAGPLPKAVHGESDEVVYINGPSWPTMLLASYASAVTLALIWLVVIPKFRNKGETERFIPGAPTVAEGTRLADTSRKVEPAASIPPERIVTLGQRLKIGSLEITPLGIARQDVLLRRTNLSGKTERRDGGSGAMALRIKLRNTSNDTVFSPLDRAFVRDKDNGVPDSFVELPNGERIYLYPLPAESEWSILGQDFPELKPGEVKETRIITAADFPSADSGMTWRLRLHTGLDSTEVVAVSVPPDN